MARPCWASLSGLSGQISDTKRPFCAPLWRSCYSVPDTTRSAAGASGSTPFAGGAIRCFLDSEHTIHARSSYISERAFCAATVLNDVTVEEFRNRLPPTLFLRPPAPLPTKENIQVDPAAPQDSPTV